MTALDTLQHLIDRFPEDDRHPFMIELQREGARTYAYEDLRRAVQGLARGLIAKGFQKGDVIGLAASGNLAWTAACLGALRAGAVAMPLDRQLGEDSLSGILEDSRPAAVFADGEQAARIGEAADDAPPVFRTDRDGGEDDSWQSLLGGDGSSLPRKT